MKLIKIIAIIFFCIIILFSNNVFALSSIIDLGEDWEIVGKQHVNTTMDTENLSDVSGQIYDILISIAVIVAIIVGAILGMQYMTAGVEKKVEVKESLIPYFISCIVVFGALGIWKTTVTIIKSVDSTSASSSSTTHQSGSGQTHGGGSGQF